MRDLDNSAPAIDVPPDSTAFAQLPSRSGGAVIIEPPRGQDPTALVATPSSVETSIVHTRACEQKLGLDPWFTMTLGRLNESGGPLHDSDPETLLKRMEGRPSVFFIHGNGYTYRAAVKEAVRIRAVLEANGGLPSDTVFIIFDWPSERVLPDLDLDLNEKSRRSRVASYHLARFLQTVPAGSKICLLGQSDGGRIVLTTLHLLSGASLPAFWSEPQVQLSSSRQDLRLRGVVLDAAAGHHWLNPGERLDQALPTCESLLNLRNCGDYVLAAYALGVDTGIRPALGRVGLRAHDLKNLGPLVLVSNRSISTRWSVSATRAFRRPWQYLKSPTGSHATHHGATSRCRGTNNGVGTVGEGGATRSGGRMGRNRSLGIRPHSTGSVWACGIRTQIAQATDRNGGRSDHPGSVGSFVVPRGGVTTKVGHHGQGDLRRISRLALSTCEEYLSRRVTRPPD
jgi:Alpha/beta hydrolase of unknown function (DUF900)